MAIVDTPPFKFKIFKIYVVTEILKETVSRPFKVLFGKIKFKIECLKASTNQKPLLGQGLGSSGYLYILEPCHYFALPKFKS